MEKQGNELHNKIKDVGVKIETRTQALEAAIDRRSADIRSEIKDVDNELKRSISDLNSKIDKGLTLVYWQISLIFITIVIPLGKLTFDYVSGKSPS